MKTLATLSLSLSCFCTFADCTEITVISTNTLKASNLTSNLPDLWRRFDDDESVTLDNLFDTSSIYYNKDLPSRDSAELHISHTNIVITRNEKTWEPIWTKIDIASTNSSGWVVSESGYRDGAWYLVASHAYYSSTDNVLSNNVNHQWSHLWGGTGKSFVVTIKKTRGGPIPIPSWCHVNADENCIVSANAPIPVKYGWLYNHYDTKDWSSSQYDDFASTAVCPNGRKVWENYMLGLDPTNSESQVTAFLSFVNGAPVVSHEPDSALVTENGYSYVTYGKTNLTDTSWVEVTDTSSTECKFFKVAVEKN